MAERALQRDDLTPEEAKAVRALERVAAVWPSHLVLFASGGALSIRRAPDDGSWYGRETEVAAVFGIRNDGGDGGDFGG